MNDVNNYGQEKRNKQLTGRRGEGLKRGREHDGRRHGYKSKEMFIDHDGPD